MARPAALSAVATIGMIVAVLSILASLLTGGLGAGAYAVSAANRARVLHNAPAALPVSSPREPILLSRPLFIAAGSRGLDPPQRKIVIDALRTKVFISDDQALQLDVLLGQAGQDIFPVPITKDSVLQAVGDEAGSLATVGQSTDEPFYFRTPAGRTEVRGDRAVFYGGGGLQAVRTSAGRRLNSTGHPVLSSQDVDGLLELVRQSCENKIAQPQIETLRRLLEDPQQQLVSLIKSESGYQIGLNSAFAAPGGYVTILFAGGPLLLSPAGRLVLRSDAASVPGVSGWVCLLVVLEAIASVGAAILLLVLMSRLARQPPRGGGAFWFFVEMKIALALIAGGALMWMIGDYERAEASSMSVAWAIIAGIAVAVAGLIYPAWLASKLQKPAIRNYLASPQD